ncbi:MAG: hypothetical protein CMD92_01700 [Gammaproteobacteria bacterium]|nr:hypothetical protein [Gammaproteobacteria bacterium]HBW82551.1 hypothetical protein [Gammaproteobacteria bacterium]|tara:strand:- start:1008 stop:1484 length:477 start_codon:yes stop_codon:yes gene_type:complete
MGSIEYIYLARGKRQAVERIGKATLEAGKGIVGDRYYQLAEARSAKGLPVMENHVSLVEREALDKFLSTHSLTLDYGEFRRSVITSGVNLNALVGKHFKLGDALLFGVELCAPCGYLASIIHPAVLPELALSAGLRATVIKSGEIQLGDFLDEKPSKD